MSFVTTNYSEQEHNKLVNEKVERSEKGSATSLL
jgi:hypothetical protein